MTPVPLTTPFRMKEAVLTIAEDDFTEAVSQAEFTSTTGEVFIGIGGNRRGEDATWDLNISAAQDLAVGGLMRYLIANQGLEKDIVLTPLRGGVSIAATVTLAAPSSIGGGSDKATLLTFTAKLACKSTPEFSDDAPTPPVE